MKLVMMIVGALLVLGGGGAGAYFYFMQEAEASAPEGEEHEVAKEEEHAKDSTHFEYVELDPLILPIVDKNGLSQVVSMVVALEVVDAAAAEKVKKLSPKIKDAYIQDLYGMLNEHAALKGGVIQVSYIKKRLNKISVDVIGEEYFNDVLLQVVQQRPL